MPSVFVAPLLCVFSLLVLLNNVVVLASPEFKHKEQLSTHRAMKVAVIGAGLAGLVSAKYSLEHGYETTVFEQSRVYAGIWRYTDQIGRDEYGVPVNSAMYKHLKTNLPKEIMILRGLEHTNATTSYVSQAYVLDYLERYVEKFKILPHIKFRHQVISVKPIEAGRWEVIVKNVLENSEKMYTFDAIMVCNGHYSKIQLPNISGMDSFNGMHLHSRDYRSPESFENKTIVIIGAGPSGVDIAKHASKVAKSVFVSRKTNSNWTIPTAENIIIKPEVVSISANGCTFEDGCYENLDTIVYCTGYEYDFPFLLKNTGISVQDNRVEHLYRHLINIEHPTMAIVGLLYGVSVFPIVDLSARYFLAHLSGKFRLPAKEEMLRSEREEQELRKRLSWPERYAHKSPDHAEKLMGKMAEEAGLEKIPRVVFKLHHFIAKNRSTDLCYRMVDEDDFEQIDCIERTLEIS